MTTETESTQAASTATETKTKGAVRKRSGSTKAKASKDKEVKRRAVKAADKAKRSSKSETSMPHVFTNSVPTKMGRVTNKPAIKVKGAFYRGAEIEGTFELAPDAEVEKWGNGDPRVAVIFSWHGWTPTRGYPRIALPKGSTHTVKQSYTGEVVREIGRGE